MSVSSRENIQDIVFKYLRENYKKEVKEYDKEDLAEERKGNKEGEDRFTTSLKEHILTEDEVIEKVNNKKERKIIEIIEEKDNKDDKTDNEDNHTKKQLLLKIVYEKSLEKYYNTKSMLYRANIRDDGKLSFSDSEYNKMLLHSMYLKKLDNEFRSMTNGKHIAQEFKDTNEIVNRYVSKENIYEKNIDFKHNKQIKKHDILQEQLENIANDISNLDINSRNYKDKYEYLMDIYLRVDAKLNMDSPNIYELQLNEASRKRQLDIEENINGTYDSHFTRNVLNSKNRYIENLELSKDKEKGLYYNEDKTISNKDANERINAHDIVIAESVDAMEEKVKSGDIDGAHEIYDNICLLVEENLVQKAINDKEGLKLSDINIESQEEARKDDIFGSGAINQNLEEIIKQAKEREDNKQNNSKEARTIWSDAEARRNSKK